MPSILCADDEPTQLILLRFAFERAGFTVFCAANGQEAIDLAIEYQPDIVLMDLMMPIMNGHQATEAIKAHPPLVNTPIVLYTAYDQAELAADAEAAGATEIIRKTIPPRVLVVKINKLLASQKAKS